MHNSAAAAWTTTILVKNIHCASCVSHVQRILARFEKSVRQVDINILSHEVRILHERTLSASEICLALSDAAFEVYSAITLDEKERKIQEFVAEDTGEGWLGAAADFWRPSSNLYRSNAYSQLSDQNHRSSHLKNCIACQKEANQRMGMSANSTTTSLGSRQEGDLAGRELYFLDVSALEVGQSTPSSPQSRPTLQQTRSNELFEAILSIGGMTCAACTSGIDHGLSSNQLPFVESVNVTLMTNSARVVFRGEDNLQKIVEAVQDLGFEAATERCGLIDTQPKEERQRTVSLKIDGMFCKHCPSRVLEAIKANYSSSVSIDKTPTEKDPVIRLTYSPSPPEITIRQVISTIKSVDELFNAKIYTPPSIEQRSQAMQKHEQQRLLIRLLFSLVVAIPTLLIGVIWMSLVPATNTVRQYFEKSVWAGTVTRADWAMFILATPVFLFAADVFHVRAIKVTTVPSQYFMFVISDLKRGVC